MSGVAPGENLDVARGAAIAVLPGIGLLSLVWLVRLYALAVGIAPIVLALRVRGLRKGRGLQGVLNLRGGNERPCNATAQTRPREKTDPPRTGLVNSVARADRGDRAPCRQPGVGSGSRSYCLRTY